LIYHYHVYQIIKGELKGAYSQQMRYCPIDILKDTLNRCILII